MIPISIIIIYTINWLCVAAAPHPIDHHLQKQLEYYCIHLRKDYIFQQGKSVSIRGELHLVDTRNDRLGFRVKNPYR